MANGWGGRRPGAGRKPGIRFKSRMELMATIFTPDDWAALLKHLYARAMSDDKDSTRAAIALLRYQFGDSLSAYDEFDLQRAGLLPRPEPEELDEDEDDDSDEDELDDETAQAILDKAEQLLYATEAEQVELGENADEQAVGAASCSGARPIFHTPAEVIAAHEFDEFAATVATAKEQSAASKQLPYSRLKDRRAGFQRHRFR